MDWSVWEAEGQRRSHQVITAYARAGREQLERSGQTWVSFMNSQKQPLVVD